MPVQALINGLNKTTDLTSREKQILKLANEGLGNKTIADKLSISPGTVKKHFDNIFRKLEVKNRIEALHVMKNF